MNGPIVEEWWVDLLKREKMTAPFWFGVPCLVCRNKSKQQHSTGLVFERLPPASWVVVAGLGVGTMVACVSYGCAAVWCMSLSLLLLLLLLFGCLSMFSCASWCALSPEKHGARSHERDTSHRRQHCCARIEGRAYCGVKLHLAACCSWVGRWDDGLGAVLLLGCCVLVVFVVVVAVVLFLLVSYLFASACWCARSS